MAKVAERPPPSALYESDFRAWASRQADLLRGRRFDELDLDHLIEEVADLGISERKTVFSHARRVLQHLLKLEFSPAEWPRRGWIDTVVSHRSDLDERLTASLRRELEAAMTNVYARARRDAAKGLKPDRIAEGELPSECPYTLAQVLDPDWLPSNRHGLDQDMPERE
jgi:hypothetical protein